MTDQPEPTTALVPPLPIDTALHEQTVQAIITSLEKANPSKRPYHLFQDWLDRLEQTLEALPFHLAQVEEPTEPETLIREILLGQDHDDLSKDGLSHLAEATCRLLTGSRAGYFDTLGRVYELFTTPNRRTAEFFTPWPVAWLMANMLIPDGEALVTKRLEEAADRTVKHSIPAQAALFTGGLTTLTTRRDDPAELGDLSTFFFTRLLPELLPYFEPLTVYEPCVGSGVLLLAAAAQFPAWMIHHGLVAFYGLDINPLCVKMARLNCHLYGLSNATLEVGDALELAPNIQFDVILTNPPFGKRPGGKR